ncbi:hypothetical protein D3C80_855870 [compost metagenome]
MVSLFDQTEPVPEKVKTLLIYKGTLEDLLVLLDANPKCRGKFLSDSESAFQMEARAEEIHGRLNLPLKAFNLGFAYYAPNASPAFLARSLNCDANRFLPMFYVVVTENEQWASLWGEPQPVPKELFHVDSSR